MARFACRCGPASGSRWTAISCAATANCISASAAIRTTGIQGVLRGAPSFRTTAGPTRRTTGPCAYLTDWQASGNTGSSGNLRRSMASKTTMLDVRLLTKYYGAVPVVSGVSFTICPGEILGYLGPNGAGKSTTVKMLTGL